MFDVGYGRSQVEACMLFFFSDEECQQHVYRTDMLLCTEKTKLFGGDRLKTFRALKNVVGVNEKREHPLM